MKKLIVFMIFWSVVLQGFTQEKDEIQKKWEQMNSTKSSLYKEFNELKFGMFIHWGAYSTLGGMWKGKQIPGLGEWVMYHGQITRDEYKDVARKFNPTGFNAEEWVKMAKDAGMRYIVAMPKHHDGFAMYHSTVTDYNIYSMTPFKRDPMEEIYNACKKYGIRLGFYYSHSIDWMDGGDAGCAQAKIANPQLKDTRAANTWDPSPVSYQEYIENKAKPQVKEILTKFPDLVELWYDYPRYMNRQQSFEFYELAYKYQPKLLINSRVGNELGDVLTAGDNEIPKEVNPKYKTWETPGTLNNTWGYKSYDLDWKSFDEMLFWIVEIASKGGNYLLNVGPDGLGVIPQESVKILKEIGAWMKINGEAIYGTGKWITLKEGPTSLEMKSTTDREKLGFRTVFTPEDFWFTAKDKNIYVISVVPPAGGKVKVKSLYKSNQQIKNIILLGSKNPLKWKATNDLIEIDLPGTLNTGVKGFALRVELK